MAKNKEQRHAEVFEEATRRMRQALSTTQDDREASLEDRRFYTIPGAQWEGAVGEQFQNRIKLENNQVLLAVIRIINEYRNNRVDNHFISKDGKDGDELAEFLAGLYRADQQDSHAEEALDNAFEEAVGGGFGAWRLSNALEDEYDDQDDRQRIRWEPITDADTCVFFDPGSIRQDKSDAKWCMVLTPTTPEAFEEAYGVGVSAMHRSIEDQEFDWYTSELVYVGEYFVCEEGSYKQHTFRNVAGGFERYKEKELTDEKRRELDRVGTIEVSSRTVRTRKVRKYILSGTGVLEDVGHIAGCHIPIVPVYGKRSFVDGRERFMGHVRHTKDMQRLDNMQLSLLAEQAASGGQEVPIFTPEQVAGLENNWRDHAVNRPAFQLVNPIYDKDGNETAIGPVDYTRPARVPEATAALMQVARESLSRLLGSQEAGENFEGDLSGKAVELIQNRIDGQSFIYMSNFAKAQARSAEIWLSMAAELYDEDSRVMKLVDEQGETRYADLGETILDEETGEAVKRYNIADAKMDVTTEIGPTSQSKKAATVRTLSEMLPMLEDPADRAVVSSMALMNIEGEGVGPVREHFRKKLVALGLVEPSDADLEEAANAQPPEPTAQDQYMMSEAEKNMADAREAEANTALKRAQTTKTLADIDREATQSRLEAVKAMTDAVTALPQ